MRNTGTQHKNTCTPYMK